MTLRTLCASPSCEELLTQPPTLKPSGSRRAIRRLFFVLSALLVLLGTIAAHAQRYTKIVVFGDSLSDTGNDLVVFLQSANPVPFPSPYTGYEWGRFTDGPDTTPAAQSYAGVWVEQMAAALPAQPAVAPSLLGGTDYAFGYGNTFDGATLFVLQDQPPLPIYEAYVENVGQQIDDYLATNPVIDDHTLFVVWAGANNLTESVGQPNSSQLIVDGAVAQIGNIQRLIDAGATQFLVPNLPNLGLVPRFNMSPTYSAAFNQASVLYNASLGTGVSLLPLANFGRHVTIHNLDVYSLMNRIVSNPATYGLQDVTDSSQGNPSVYPDTYLFWDSLHPTARGHNILAQAALQAIEPKGCLKQISAWPLEYVGSSAANCR